MQGDSIVVLIQLDVPIDDAVTPQSTSRYHHHRLNKTRIKKSITRQLISCNPNVFLPTYLTLFKCLSYFTLLLFCRLI